ncbi:MAG: hypothetical protein H6729_13885 [Deltaproteobacteria bacterium]|nr:hypothetical protein [Deltaproteobacteria bacterium]
MVEAAELKLALAGRHLVDGRLEGDGRIEVATVARGHALRVDAVGNATIGVVSGDMTETYVLG